MTHFLLRKGGIPALACVASAIDNASFLHCRLQVKYDKDGLQATLSLQHCTYSPVHGFTDTQSFDLIYDADNIIPTTTKCQTSKRALTLPDREYIARNAQSDIRVLSLHLQKPCPIVCSNVSSDIVPKANHETSFRRFVDLAKSTKVEIAFDWKWLSRKHIGPFLDIVSQPERFCGFPVDAKNLKERWQKDWTVFGLEEENVVAYNEPPSYTEATKRPLEISSSPRSPLAKRVLFSLQGSPTEKATTASQPNSPKHTSTTIDESQRTTSSHAGTDTNLSLGLEKTVRRIALDVFSTLLSSSIDSSSSLSTSPNLSPRFLNRRTHSSSVPSRKSIRRLRSLLTARAAAHIEAKLGTICSDIEYDANVLRETADEEFLAGVAEEKLDIKQRRDDAVEEIENLVNDALAELLLEVGELVKQAAEEVEESIDARVAKHMNTTWNKALAGGLLDMNARPEKVAVRKGYAAGDRKRKLGRFSWCVR